MGSKLRVYIVSSVTFFLVVLLVVLGLHGVRRTDLNTDAMSAHIVPRLRYLEQMRFGAIRVVSSTSELIISSLVSGDEDKANSVKSAEIALIREGEKEFLSAYARLANHHAPHHYHAPFDVADVRPAFDRLSAASMQIVEMVRENATPKEFADAKAVLERLETDVLNVIDEALVRAQELADVRFEETSASIARLGKEILALGLIAAATLLFYVLFVNQLLRRETEARQRAEKLALARKQEIELRKNLETRLASHQKMEALGTMLGGIAHSVNNFLTPIKSLSKMLKKDLPADAEQQEDLDHILRSATSASTVLADVLAFSHSDERGGEVSELVSCLHNSLSVTDAALPSTVAVHESIHMTEAWVPAKSADIEAMVLNLMSNAIDAMKDKVGHIGIELEQLRVGGGVIEGKPVRLEPGDYVRLRFKDNGVGISMDALPKIFDPFFTTKEVGEGTGLGLSLTYSIVSHAGGDILVESSESSGTRFDIILPLIEKPAVDTAA